jgi:hypothetical protein
LEAFSVRAGRQRMGESVLATIGRQHDSLPRAGAPFALAQTALALADISRNNSGAACCRLEIECVSYWEWAKLISLSLVISIAITAVAGAMWWTMK